MKREIRDYLEDILNECNYLLNRVERLDYHLFENNDDLKKAFVRSLEIIGEAIKKIPDDVRNNHSEISWKDASGMRNKLIHEYFGVNYKIVWKTIVEEIPKLRKVTKNILDSL